MKFRPRAEVLIFRQNKILADMTGDWVVFPGGGVDSGETPREAVKRECLEEAGRVVINVDVASAPTMQTWPSDYARKEKWSKGYVGGLTYWFTGSSSPDVTDNSHPDFQDGFAWHPVSAVLDRIQGELSGNWGNDVKVRVDILKTHLASGQKIAEVTFSDAMHDTPLLAYAHLPNRIDAQRDTMLKTACRIFDVYDDADLEVATKLASAGFGGTVVADRESLEALHDHQFGLVLKTASGSLRRRYPLHDADSTKLSAAYFGELKSSLPEDVIGLIETKIAAAEQHFDLADRGIAAEHVADMMNVTNYIDSAKIAMPRQKIAHTEQHWGLALDGRNLFPLHDATLVKTAIARFPETAGSLEPEERFAYARAISKRASALRVAVPSGSMIDWYTADSVNLSALADGISERKRAMKAAAMSTDVLDQLYEAAGCYLERGGVESNASFNHRSIKQASLRRATLDPAKIISVLQNIDKLAGFGAYHYMRGLLDPFASCFTRDDISKHAAMIMDGVDLSTLDQNQLTAKFGPEFVQEFTQNPAQVYQSLPSPMKSIVRSFCATGSKKNESNVPVGDPAQGLAPSYANSGGFVGS